MKFPSLAVIDDAEASQAGCINVFNCAVQKDEVTKSTLGLWILAPSNSLSDSLMLSVSTPGKTVL